MIIIRKMNPQFCKDQPGSQVSGEALSWQHWYTKESNFRSLVRVWKVLKSHIKDALFCYHHSISHYLAVSLCPCLSASSTSPPTYTAWVLYHGFGIDWKPSMVGIFVCLFFVCFRFCFVFTYVKFGGHQDTFFLLGKVFGFCLILHGPGKFIFKP